MVLENWKAYDFSKGTFLSRPPGKKSPEIYKDKNGQLYVFYVHFRIFKKIYKLNLNWYIGAVFQKYNWSGYEVVPPLFPFVSNILQGKGGGVPPIFQEGD